MNEVSVSNADIPMATRQGEIGTQFLKQILFVTHQHACKNFSTYGYGCLYLMWQGPNNICNNQKLNSAISELEWSEMPLIHKDDGGLSTKRARKRENDPFG